MPAIRDNAHKPPIGYVLTFPEALTELANVCRHGEAKYSQWNYLASNKPLVEEYVNCLTRHLTKWVNGKDVDDESGLNHLAFVLWNALALCQFALDKTGIDDRPKRDKSWQDHGQRVAMTEDPEKGGLVFGGFAQGFEEALARVEKEIHIDMENPKATHYGTFTDPGGALPFERLVPRYTEYGDFVHVEDKVLAGSDLEPDKPDVEVSPDPDPLSPAGSVLVRLYDLGTFQMIESDFRNRDSSLVWDTRDSARKAVFGLVERGWARRVSDLP